MRLTGKYLLGIALTLFALSVHAGQGHPGGGPFAPVWFIAAWLLFGASTGVVGAKLRMRFFFSFPVGFVLVVIAIRLYFGELPFPTAFEFTILFINVFLPWAFAHAAAHVIVRKWDERDWG